MPVAAQVVRALRLGEPFLAREVNEARVLHVRGVGRGARALLNRGADVQAERVVAILVLGVEKRLPLEHRLGVGQVVQAYLDVIAVDRRCVEAELEQRPLVGAGKRAARREELREAHAEILQGEVVVLRNPAQLAVHVVLVVVAAAHRNRRDGSRAWAHRHRVVRARRKHLVAAAALLVGERHVLVNQRLVGGRACVVPEAERGSVLAGDAHVERLRHAALAQLAGDAARNLRRLQEAGVQRLRDGPRELS